MLGFQHTVRKAYQVLPIDTDMFSVTVHGIVEQLHYVRIIRQFLSAAAFLTVACIGGVMALMMWIATWEQDERDGIRSKAPAPHWPLIVLGWVGMLSVSTLLGLVFRSKVAVRSVRGSLEYTTLIIYELTHGRRYAYAKDTRATAGEDPSETLRREIHQLKVEAGLVGWSEEMLQEQLSALRDAFEAKKDLMDKSSTNKVSNEGVALEEKATAVAEVVKCEGAKLFAMVKNTVGSMPLIGGIVACIFAVATVGVGAMGAFLTIKIANMPNPDDNPLWIELCWQLINAIFTIVAVWKGPQRVSLLYRWIRKDWVVGIEGIPRSLLCPGVLLTHRQVGYIAGLRMTNIVSQYLVSFFMWAWLPRCLQEERELKIDCTSRPAWGVPCFMVLGMGTDIVANVLLSSLIASCPYIKWPIAAIDGPVLKEEAVG